MTNDPTIADILKAATAMTYMLEYKGEGQSPYYGAWPEDAIELLLSDEYQDELKLSDRGTYAVTAFFGERDRDPHMNDDYLMTVIERSKAGRLFLSFCDVENTGEEESNQAIITLKPPHPLIAEILLGLGYAVGTDGWIEIPKQKEPQQKLIDTLDQAYSLIAATEKMAKATGKHALVQSIILNRVTIANPQSPYPSTLKRSPDR